MLSDEGPSAAQSAPFRPFLPDLMRKIYRPPRIFHVLVAALAALIFAAAPAGHAASAPSVLSQLTGAAAPAAAAPAPAASAAVASSASATHALVSNGLIAQLVRQSGRWGHAVALEARRTGTWGRGFSALGSDWQQITRSSDRRAALFTLAWQDAGVFLLALAGAALLSWLLRRPRELLAQHAQRGEMVARHNDARELARIPAANRADAVRAATDKAEAGLGAADHAVDAVDAAQDTPGDPAARARTAAAAASAAAATAATAATAAASAAASASRPAAPADDVAEANAQRDAQASTSKQLNGARSAANHLRLLKRLPYILAHFVLTLLPLIAFFLIGTGLASLWIDDSGAAQDVLETAVNAFLVVGTVRAFVRLCLAPRTPPLRLLHMPDSVALRLESWICWIVALVVLGNAIADVCSEIGMSNALHDAISRLTVLVGHVLLGAMVLRYRRPVAGAIRAWSGRRPSLVLLGHWVADIWAFAALFLIGALWFVWALNVKNGLTQVFDLFGQAIAVLAAARVIAIVVLGGLARLFHTDESQPLSPARRRSLRYYPLLRRIVSTLISMAALVMILQLLGMHAWQWVLAGPVGKNLLSAALTVGVAFVAALLIWEGINATVERRLERWNGDEDRLRAARLRTLLPMLRSILFIVIALIVGLTALNQIGINTAPLLAGASIIGVALGFGSQKLVQDFITGIFLLMENAMQVGDWVTVAGVSGTVEYLSIRTVRLRGGDGSLYTVPFSSVSTVNNTNRGLGNAAVKVSVAYDEDIEQVIALLKEVGAELRDDPAFGAGILADLEYWGIDVVEGAMVTLSGQIRTRDSARWGVQREFNRRILQRMRAAGIRLADSQRRLLEDTRAPHPAAPADTADTPTQTPATGALPPAAAEGTGPLQSKDQGDGHGDDASGATADGAAANTAVAEHASARAPAAAAPAPLPKGGQA
jgi:small-conductance mechanosensitive channel